MLKERPALGGSGQFETMNVRPQTWKMLKAIAAKMNWNIYEVAHALVEAEAKAQGLVK